jgi:dipeptidyl aminopeptidase/acylaminoacyl peptidase
MIQPRESDAASPLLTEPSASVAAPAGWRRRARALAPWLLASLLALGLGAKLAHHVQVAQAMLHPTRTPVQATDLALAQQALHGGVQPVTFATADGLLLQGWYKPSRTGAVVIFVHGGEGNRLWFLDQAQALAERGMGALLYDSRASGNSEGDTQAWGDLEQEDLTAALNWVSARPDADPMRLGAEGFSIGASTVCMVAASDPRLKAVVLHSMWSSLREELRHKSGNAVTTGLLLLDFWWAGVDPDRVQPAQVIQQIAPRPLRLVAAENDHDTPVAVEQAVFERAGSPKALWRIPDADHLNYREHGGNALREEVAQFFVNSL